MKAEKLKRCTEGIIMIALGVFFLVLALGIKNNPVKTPGFLGVLVQAKLLPIVTSVFTIIFGALLTVKLYKGTAETDQLSKDVWIRELILTVMTVAYLIIIVYVGFLLPTIAYLGAMLLYLNWKERKPLFLLALVAAYTVATIYVVPLILNLNLM